MQTYLLLALACFVTTAVWAELTPEQEAAKQSGIILFNQYRTAEPQLRIAAEAGDAESQFYLGEELRLRDRFMTKEVVHCHDPLGAPRRRSLLCDGKLPGR